MASRTDPAAAANQVRQAAEQLAAGLEAAAVTGYSHEAVAELKHIHGLTHKISSAVQQLQTTTSGSTKELKAAVQSLESTLNKQGRLQALRWALDHIDLVETFSYSYTEQSQYHSYHATKRTDSTDFIQNLLLYAMENQGSCFPGPATEHDKASHKEFRGKIKAAVHILTGIEPRLVDQGDKGWAIFI